MAEPAPAAPDPTPWTEQIEDADLKTALSKFDTPDKFFDAAGIKAPEAKPAEPQDWRADLPDDLKKNRRTLHI